MVWTVIGMGPPDSGHRAMYQPACYCGVSLYTVIPARHTTLKSFANIRLRRPVVRMRKLQSSGPVQRDYKHPTLSLLPQHNKNTFLLQK